MKGRRTGTVGGATRVVTVRAVETGEDPAEFAAVTVTVYDVVAASPVKVAEFVPVEAGVTGWPPIV